MDGLELILASVCNDTEHCEPVYDNPLTELTINPRVAELQNLTSYINGRHIKIGTYNSYPLSWAEAGPNGTLVGMGVAFDIVEILQRKFNFTYEVIVPETNYEFGGIRPEHSLVGMLNASQIDMAAAFISKLVRYYRTVSYSSDLDEGVWMMMLKRPKASAAGSGLLAPFNALVWYLTLAAVLSYGPIITFLTRLRSRFVKDEEKHLPLKPSFWFVYSAFIKQGTSLSPLANTTRILFATWWIFIILLSAFYTANLTAFLTLSKFTLEIETPQDLYKKNYRWISTEGGSVQYAVRSNVEGISYLNKMVQSGRGVFLNYPSIKDYLAYVDGGGVLVKETVNIDYIMYGDYLEKAKRGVAETDRCTYVVAPKPFMKKQRAFAYPLGSPLRTLFDNVLSHILQAGIIRFLEHRDLPSTKICPLDLQSKDRQLRNTDLLMTYLIMAVGLCAAVAVFIGEVIIKRKFLKTSKQPKKVKVKALSKKSKHNDDSRPPPYDSLFGRTKYKIDETTQTRVVNGREYYVFNSSRGTRLIPVRAPSAFLYR